MRRAADSAAQELSDWDWDEGGEADARDTAVNEVGKEEAEQFGVAGGGG